MTKDNSHNKAVKNYNNKNYKKLQCYIKSQDAEIIDQYCKNNHISKASFILNSCKTAMNDELMLEYNEKQVCKIKQIAAEYNVTPTKLLLKCLKYCYQSNIIQDIL